MSGESFENWYKYKYKGFYSNGADKRTEFTAYELKECWEDATQAERKRLDNVWYEVTKSQIEQQSEELIKLRNEITELKKAAGLINDRRPA